MSVELCFEENNTKFISQKSKNNRDNICNSRENIIYLHQN